jgi:hypothetical protein
MASISYVAADGRRAQRILVGLFIFLALIACSLFLIRYVMGPFALSKHQADFWDVAFKAIGGLVAIIGAILALSKYFDEREKENRVALIEAQKPFSTKRQEVYFQLVSTTSTLANSNPSGPAWKEAEEQFWWLFWGVVPMVADDQVGSAVDAFHHAILDHREDGVLLRNLSMDLARACRISLGFIDMSDPSAGSNATPDTA